MSWKEVHQELENIEQIVQSMEADEGEMEAATASEQEKATTSSVDFASLGASPSKETFSSTTQVQIIEEDSKVTTSSKSSSGR